MEIKTTLKIQTESKVYAGRSLDKFDKFQDKKWIAVDDLINEIRKHSKCNNYHVINHKKATCLDVILSNLK